VFETVLRIFEIYKTPKKNQNSVESFPEAHIPVLLAFLRAKREFTKEQLALAVEVLNSWPDPECFVLRPGAGDEGQSATLQDDFADVEHIMFVARDAAGAAVASNATAASSSNVAPPPPPTTHRVRCCCYFVASCRRF